MKKNIKEKLIEQNRFKQKSTFRRITHIVSIVILVMAFLSLIDVALIFFKQLGPFFAIPYATYDDGGTKVYYGMGYKVIKYNEYQGRHNIDLGLWNLKYSNIATKVSIMNLAIDFTNDEAKMYHRYHNQYLTLNEKIIGIDNDKKEIYFKYNDPTGGNKYNLVVICKMHERNAYLLDYKVTDNVEIVGTLIDKGYSNEENANVLILNDVFIKSVTIN